MSAQAGELGSLAVKEHGLITENSVNFNYSGGPPAQVSTGRFITSPKACEKFGLTHRALEQEGRREDPKLCHYLVMRGSVSQCSADVHDALRRSQGP